MMSSPSSHKNFYSMAMLGLILLLVVTLSLLHTLPDLQATTATIDDAPTLSLGKDDIAMKRVNTTTTSTDRRVIALYEDLHTSQDFTIITYPPPKIPVRYTPKVSVRDCNRSDEMIKQKNPQQSAKQQNRARRRLKALRVGLGPSKIIWGHLKLILKDQREHCLSALTNNPLRYEVPNEQPLFVAHAKNAHVNSNGVVQTSNEMLVYKRSCFGASKVKRYIGNELVKDTNITNCAVRVKDLFVASQWWGSETGHFIAETLPRVLSYLELSQRMPVHLWGNETGLARAWMDHYNVTTIRGNNICAENVYVASPSDCRGGAYMSNMHLKMREVANPLAAISEAEEDDMQQSSSNNKTVLIFYRDNGTPNSSPFREPIRDINKLVTTMQLAGYTNIKVVKASDRNFWSCISCQMEEYRKTWLFIVSHGAGLTNILFMPVGTYVVEIASLQRPEEPYYSSAGQMTYSLGQHYYHYYWKDKEVDGKNLDIPFFVSELKDFAAPR